jgi:hypothetical protein
MKDCSQSKKFFTNNLAGMTVTPTFALPKEKWDFTHVAANKNKITIIRSQPG